MPSTVLPLTPPHQDHMTTSTSPGLRLEVRAGGRGPGEIAVRAEVAADLVELRQLVARVLGREHLHAGDDLAAVRGMAVVDAVRGADGRAIGRA